MLPSTSKSKKRRKRIGATPAKGLTPYEVHSSETRAYVKLPVAELENTPRLCVFIGPNKTWEVNAQSLIKRLDNKRKCPIDFRENGPCWTFYFDEEEGTLYNDYNDDEPYMRLIQSPKRTCKATTVSPTQTKTIRHEKKTAHTSPAAVQPAMATIPTKTILPDKTEPGVTNIQDKKDIVSEKPKAKLTVKQQHTVSPGALHKSGKEHEANGELEDAVKKYQAALDAGFSPAGYDLGKLLLKQATAIFAQVARLGHKGALRELTKLLRNFSSENEEKQNENRTNILQVREITPKEEQISNSSPLIDERQENSHDEKSDTQQITVNHKPKQCSQSSEEIRGCQDIKLSYEQIANHVKDLDMISQYRLAKHCLIRAAAQKHSGAAEQLNKWDTKQQKCTKPHAIFYAQGSLNFPPLNDAYSVGSGQRFTQDTSDNDITAIISNLQMESATSEAVNVSYAAPFRYYNWTSEVSLNPMTRLEMKFTPVCPTVSGSSDISSTSWQQEENLDISASDEPLMPEPDCAQTENSGCEIGETEAKNINLSPPALPARTGCFFCRLRDKLSSFFSQQVKR